jgi:hypothetical protein
MIVVVRSVATFLLSVPREPGFPTSSTETKRASVVGNASDPERIPLAWRTSSQQMSPRFTGGQAVLTALATCDEPDSIRTRRTSRDVAARVRSLAHRNETVAKVTIEGTSMVTRRRPQSVRQLASPYPISLSSIRVNSTPATGKL